jgi:hypothetical protein
VLSIRGVLSRGPLIALLRPVIGKVRPLVQSIEIGPVYPDCGLQVRNTPQADGRAHLEARLAAK